MLFLNLKSDTVALHEVNILIMLYLAAVKLVHNKIKTNMQGFNRNIKQSVRGRERKTWNGFALLYGNIFVGLD